MDKCRVVKAAASLKEFCKRSKDVCTKCMFYEKKEIGNCCKLYGVPHTWKVNINTKSTVPKKWKRGV